jgi:hypothetical protein
LRAYGGLPSTSVVPLPLDAKYQQFAQRIIDQQLAIGGVRLAAILNSALSKASSP